MSDREQAGVIAFRRKKSGIEICLIRNKGSRKWKIPKGFVDPGETPEQAALKEAWEEAGIPAETARRAHPGGTAHILRAVPEGVQSEVVHVYDLELPDGFQPRNQDGEVSEFLLVELHAVKELALTLEAQLAAKDYFSRRA